MTESKTCQEDAKINQLLARILGIASNINDQSDGYERCSRALSYFAGSEVPEPMAPAMIKTPESVVEKLDFILAKLEKIESRNGKILVNFSSAINF